MKYFILVPLIWLAYQDCKYMQISLKSLAIFMIMSMLGNQPTSALIILVISFVLFFSTKGIAIADIFTLTCCANFIPIEKIGPFLIATGSSSSLFAIIRKKTKIPFIPFILIGFLFTNFILQ